ncbi:MAG: GNAT family N-acetyltransferase [Alphaproteobacteria bacterium]|nr:GNAT family N-acetyltransferase [Alphaproteobacteria bacterium]
MNTCLLNDIQIAEASAVEDIGHIRRLFRAYAEWLNVDLCFQGFEEELDSLPGAYAPPCGRLLLAKAGGEVAGCVALRPLENDICEMKRLWVEPGIGGRGIGRGLAEAIVDAGRELGYRAMRLDTMPKRLKAAGHIYDALGFKEIPDYYHNPLEGVVMYECRLT